MARSGSSSPCAMVPEKETEDFRWPTIDEVIEKVRKRKAVAEDESGPSCSKSESAMTMSLRSSKRKATALPNLIPPKRKKATGFMKDKRKVAKKETPNPKPTQTPTSSPECQFATRSSIPSSPSPPPSETKRKTERGEMHQQAMETRSQSHQLWQPPAPWYPAPQSQAWCQPPPPPFMWPSCPPAPPQQLLSNASLPWPYPPPYPPYCYNWPGAMQPYRAIQGHTDTQSSSTSVSTPSSTVVFNGAGTPSSGSAGPVSTGQACSPSKSANADDTCEPDQLYRLDSVDSVMALCHRVVSLKTQRGFSLSKALRQCGKGLNSFRRIEAIQQLKVTDEVRFQKVYDAWLKGGREGGMNALACKCLAFVNIAKVDQARLKGRCV